MWEGPTDKCDLSHVRLLLMNVEWENVSNNIYIYISKFHQVPILNIHAIWWGFVVESCRSASSTGQHLGTWQLPTLARLSTLRNPWIRWAADPVSIRDVRVSLVNGLTQLSDI